MTSNIATIKLEEEQESVTEIQTYLETFNKEIEEGQELQHVQLQQVEGLSNVEDGTYFVGDAYQTVTVVPSDSREVSYILIVQQPESEEKERKSTEELIAALTETATVEKEEVEGEQDLTVYDFKDNEDNEAPVESETEEDKAKIIKLLPKKSQTVTLTQQAHMCNYCNYTSPKRLLAVY